MLRSIQTFIGYTLLATDGEFGRVDDMLFDDRLWSTAYLMAKIGGLFGVRKVLLPPTTLGRPDGRSMVFPVAYSKEQINQCPEIVAIRDAGPVTAGSLIGEDDPHVRSSGEIMHCRAREIDGNLCQVRDIIVDDLAWAIRFLVVDPVDDLRRRSAMISPFRLREIIPQEE
jgi:hypothetical protein